MPALILFILLRKRLGHIMNKFGFNLHFYADDVQIYFTFDADRVTSNVLTNCFKKVEHCLSLNKLKLNKKKTQCIVLSRQVFKYAAVVFGNNFSDLIDLKCV